MTDVFGRYCSEVELDTSMIVASTDGIKEENASVSDDEIIRIKSDRL